MHAQAASSSGAKKLHRYVLRERQTSYKMAARRERGLSQLDHSDSESKCHRRPTGNHEPEDGDIARGLLRWPNCNLGQAANI